MTSQSPDTYYVVGWPVTTWRCWPSSVRGPILILVFLLLWGQGGGCSHSCSLQALCQDLVILWCCENNWELITTNPLIWSSYHSTLRASCPEVGLCPHCWFWKTRSSLGHIIWTAPAGCIFAEISLTCEACFKSAPPQPSYLDRTPLKLLFFQWYVFGTAGAIFNMLMPTTITTAIIPVSDCILITDCRAARETPFSILLTGDNPPCYLPFWLPVPNCLIYSITLMPQDLCCVKHSFILLTAAIVSLDKSSAWSRLQSGSALPDPGYPSHQAGAGRAGNTLHPTAQSQGLQAAGPLSPKGSAAHRVCPQIMLGLESIWSPSTSGEVHGPVYLVHCS